MSKARPFVAMALAFTLAAPPLFASTRGQQRQELEQLARDLNSALGRASAEVDGVHRPDPTAAPPVARLQAIRAEALVDAMNRERAAYGLKPLHLNQELSLAAGDRIDDMFAKHYFSHVSPDGIDPFSWADKRGYDYSEIGENLAVGYPTADDVVDGWMHSPGHRANILKADFDEIGIATAAASPTRTYAGPTVVAMYGTRT